MAVLRNNKLLEGFSGAIGNMLVLRQYKGKTLLTLKGRKPKEQSELQRNNRSKFKQAAYYARTILLDPQKKSYYQSKAKKLNLPNAYTAAVTDYMRKASIKDLNTKKFNVATGGEVSVQVTKKEFAPQHVTISVVDNQGRIIQHHKAERKDQRYYCRVLLNGNEAVAGFRVMEGDGRTRVDMLI